MGMAHTPVVASALDKDSQSWGTACCTQAACRDRVRNPSAGGSWWVGSQVHHSLVLACLGSWSTEPASAVTEQQTFSLYFMQKSCTSTTALVTTIGLQTHNGMRKRCNRWQSDVTRFFFRFECRMK